MKPDRRGSWYLLTGAILGVVVGLVYSWEISPVKYVNAPPSALRADYKSDYRALIAEAYLYSDDLLRAESRLAQLKDDNPIQALTIQAQQAQAEGQPQEEVDGLKKLALALAAQVTPESKSSQATATASPNPAVSSPFPASPDSSATPFPIDTVPISPTIVAQVLPSSTLTFQPASTTTPSPTPGAPFMLQEAQMVCNVNQTVPQIQVDVRNAAGQPVPSVEMIVTWDTGEDHFFTGLQPEKGLGYGDFVVTPEVVYSIRLAVGGQPVNNLSTAECIAEDGSTYWGAWHLIFGQP